MKVAVKIEGIKYINEFDSYWSNEDFVKLLKLFDFPDAEQVSAEELEEMLLMSITDHEPEEAAQILITYKLGDQLTKGQILSLSHEMKEDKVAEQYPEPELHFDLFNLNQLLYKAYGGIFPNTQASVIEIEVLSEEASRLEMTEEIMTKLLSAGLNEKCIIRRLYADQLEGKVPFRDASKFIWLLTKKNENSFELLTSRYWIEKEDIDESEYETNIVFFENNE